MLVSFRLFNLTHEHHNTESNTDIKIKSYKYLIHPLFLLVPFFQMRQTFSECIIKTKLPKKGREKGSQSIAVS